MRWARTILRWLTGRSYAHDRVNTLFIGWSGSRSEQIARYLERWLKRVLPELEVLSSFGIPKGSTWIPRLQQRLSASDLGVISITPENVDAAWVHLEAGALGVRSNWNGVFLFLFEVEPHELSNPLKAFQAVEFSRAEVKKMVFDLCRIAGISEAGRKELFDSKWPSLYQALGKLSSTVPSERSKPLPVSVKVGRMHTIQEILDSGGPPEGWRTNSACKEYALMKDAEKEDEASPLAEGTRVRVQRFHPDDFNGKTGVVGRRYAPFHYAVQLQSDPPQQRNFHVMYLTPEELLKEEH